VSELAGEGSERLTNEAFVALLESRIDAMRATLSKKASEYASNADRLHNFKRGAEMLRTSSIKTCASFMTKHLVSIFDLVEMRDNGVPVKNDVIDEKIGDAINYLVLLEALLKESPT
jgi:hypothetical protein